MNKVMPKIQGLTIGCLLSSSTLSRFISVESTELLYLFSCLFILSVVLPSSKGISTTQLKYFFILLLIVVYPLFFTPDIATLILLITSVICGLAALRCRPESITYLFKSLVFFGLITAALVIYGTVIHGNYLVFYEISDYLAIGITLSLTCIIMTHKVITETRRWGYMKFLLYLSMFSAYIALLLSSKGAIIFTVLAVVLFYWRDIGFKRWFYLLVALTMITYLFKNSFGNIGLNRLLNFSLDKNVDESTFLRLLTWKEHYVSWLEKPLFGYGLGYDLPNPLHAHNFILQILFDGGILYLLLWCLLSIWIYFSVKPLISPTSLLLKMLILVLILEFSKSHVIYSARSLFIFIALLLSLRSQRVAFK